MANSISDYLHDYSVRVFDNLPVPILTVTGEGTAGTTLYEYKATFATKVGESLPSDVVSIATGNATLNGFNKNRLSVLEIPAATTKVRYWKNAWTYYTQTLRANSTGYDLGDYMVLATNSQVRYQCTTAGTSASSDPGTWPTTLGNTKTDGTVIWTAVTNKNDSWVLLGEVDPDPGQIYDTGQATTSATVPTTDTSGRPGVIAILPKPGTMIQRAERIDVMSLFSQALQDGFDLIHKSGDVISGCSEYQIDGNLWGFNEGKIYFLGRFIDVPAGQVTLTGSGEEKVGVIITPLYETADDDHVWRCGEDEGVAGEYANTGPDVLYFQFTWAVDDPTAILIKEFVDGVPKQATLPIERTALDRALATRTFDVSGSFVVENFPLNTKDHPTNASKLHLTIGKGLAYPNGYPVKIEYERHVDLDRALDVQAENNSSIDAFVYTGAVNDWNRWEANTVYDIGDIRVDTQLNGYRYVVTAKAGDFESGATEPTWTTTPGNTVIDNDLEWTCLGVDNYDLSGKTIVVTVGDGNQHTITFSNDDLTATQVAAELEALNNYPTSASLVDAVVGTTLCQLRAVNGRFLNIDASSTALNDLGWASGITYPTGTRVYKCNNDYIKTVSDLNYKAEHVAQITHNGTTHKDLLPNTNVVTILGASATEADCNDEKWTYESEIDFIKEGNYISFAGVGGGEPAPGSVYYVKYYYNKNATKGSRVLCQVTDAKVVKTGEDLADNLTFTDATSIVSVLTGAAVTPAGAPKDVVEILRVNNSPGQSVTQYTSYSLLKNSGAIEHETSQVDWSEAGTPGSTGSGQPSNGATYYVSYTFWHHAVEGDYVSADSYDDYPSIELAPNGVWSLRDCIDFRCDGGWKPIHGEDTTLDYEFYLARADKLVVDDYANFYLLKGAPAIIPPLPQDQVGALTLAVIRMNPYTYDKDDLAIISTEPTRYTQNQIKDLINRVERIEYRQLLTDLNNEIAGHEQAVDSVGFFSDAITGFNRVSVEFNKGGLMHTVAHDTQNNVILLPADQTVKELHVSDGDSDGFRRIGNTLMLDFQESVMINQSLASRSINVNPDNVFSFANGTMTLTPASDVFVDETQAPALNVDFDNNLTGLVQQLVNATPELAAQYNSTIWGQWNRATPQDVADARAAGTLSSMYTGDMAAIQGTSWQDIGPGSAWTRTGTSRSLQPERITRDLGERVVDMSLVPMMRTTDSNGNPFLVHVRVLGLITNADHAVSIGGIPVNFVYDAAADDPRGEAGTNSYQGRSTVKTDSTGALTGYFAMPQGVPAGTQSVRVFYYDDEDSSFAVGAFYSQGFRQTTQSTTVGFDTLTVRETTGGTENTQTLVTYGDPLAYTFITEGSTRYISAVGVYFKTKSNTMPVVCEIREVQNGYPTRKVLATATKEAADITVSDDASVETKFSFEEVKGYRNNEYCIVLITNCDEYEVWYAELGDVDISSGNMIASQPYGGVLFHSPNNSTWEAMTKSDLKFKMYEANFEDECSIVFQNLTGVQATRLALKVDEFLAPGSGARWAYKSDLSPVWTRFNPRVDTELGTEITQCQIRVDVTSVGGSYALVEKWAGIVLLVHQLEANYIGNAQFFTDPLLYPNSVRCVITAHVDGTNGAGVKTVTPYYSIDDGDTWVELKPPSGYVPVAKTDPYYEYVFATPPEDVVITGATNAEPIVVTSENHGFTNNSIVVISEVGGNTNANGTWRVTNATADTFELYDLAGNAAVGNSAYITGGLINLNEFNQLRPRLYLATSNNAVTPRIAKIGFIASRI